MKNTTPATKQAEHDIVSKIEESLSLLREKGVVAFFDRAERIESNRLDFYAKIKNSESVAIREILEILKKSDIFQSVRPVKFNETTVGFLSTIK